MSDEYRYDLKHFILMDKLCNFKEAGIKIPALISKVGSVEEEEAKTIKGYYFFRFMREIVNNSMGFGLFIKKMISRFSFKLIHTEHLFTFFVNYFLQDENPGKLLVNPDKVKWDVWVKHSDFPPNFDLTFCDRTTEFIQQCINDPGVENLPLEKLEKKVLLIIRNSSF